MLKRLGGFRVPFFPGSSRRGVVEELPPALGARLREIPRRVLLCRDIDRLWAPLLRDELDPGEADRCRAHLRSCGRCRELLVTFEAARQDDREPSASLSAALRRIPGRVDRRLSRTPPWWLLDLRFAAALCYSLAVLAVALCGSSARCLSLPAGWAEPVVSVAERVEDGSQSAVRGFMEALRGAWHRPREGEAQQPNE